MKLLLPDTHAIFWYEFGDPKLSRPVEQAFKEAESGSAQLISHPIVLADFYWLLKKAGLGADFLPYMQFLRTNPNYRHEPIAPEDISRLDQFCEIPEMHDRLIAITADRLGATVLTRDPVIQRSAKVRWLW
jgi:PIN domain nuclease of toxin-antitoxin system